MDKAGIQAEFVAAGLSRLIKDIDFLARPSIRLTTTPIDESKLPVGTSKLGGVPDVPPGVTWPERKGVPQSFIAQLRLDAAHPYDIDGVLPQHGMLWFFYDAKQNTYGDDPADQGGWYVLFSDDLSNLQRTPAPAALPTASRFKASSVSFSSEITLSHAPQTDVPNFDWTQAEQKQYEKLLSTFPTPADHAALHHRLLGNPDTIQDDMRNQCQLISNGVTDDNDPLATALAAGAKDWQLLLQIDTDEQVGMRWGSTGTLYYWIKQADLQACSFGALWLVLQSE